MLFVGLIIIMLAGLAWYSVQRSANRADAKITAMLIGKWKVQSSREPWMKQEQWEIYSNTTDLTSFYLFKPDGTYELMTWDAAFSPSLSRRLEKGNYKISGQTLKFRDFKMFWRPHRRDEGKDVEDTSKPCDSLSCAVDWEVYNGYIQMAKEGVSFKIVRANWTKNYFVTEPIVASNDFGLRSKQASWTKQP